MRVTEDSESFLFTLVGPSRGEPMKMNPKPGAHGGVRCDSEKCPCFGTSEDYHLEVRNNFSATRHLRCGFIFPDSFDKDSCFCGRKWFELEELEVFKANLV